MSPRLAHPGWANWLVVQRMIVCGASHLLCAWVEHHACLTHAFVLPVRSWHWLVLLLGGRLTEHGDINACSWMRWDAADHGVVSNLGAVRTSKLNWDGM